MRFYHPSPADLIRKKASMKATKFSRNDPCPCGAKTEDGKSIKYKKHCLPKEQGFIYIDGSWVSKKVIDAKIAEKTKNIPPVKTENSNWDMK